MSDIYNELFHVIRTEIEAACHRAGLNPMQAPHFTAAAGNILTSKPMLDLVGRAATRNNTHAIEKIEAMVAPFGDSYVAKSDVLAILKGE